MSTENLPYHPYTKEEYLELKETFENNVTQYLPDNLADWAWNNYKRINNTNEPKPCTSGCGGAAAHWRKATETIREFINKVEGV
jgi:hypothetical protein